MTQYQTVRCKECEEEWEEEYPYQYEEGYNCPHCESDDLQAVGKITSDDEKENEE